MAETTTSNEKVVEPKFTGEDLSKGNAEPNTSNEAEPKVESEVAGEEETPKKQSREENAKFAELRRQKEAEELRQKELRQSFNKGVIEGIGGKNPYTNTPITDDIDLQEYLDMKQLASQGKDPIVEYPTFLKEKTRQEKQMLEQKQMSDKKAQEFIEEFNQKYPGKFKGVWDDPAFQDYAEGKLDGKRSLVSVYEGYLKLIGQQAEIIADRKVVKAQSSPGSLADSGVSAPTKDWRTMTGEEFKAFVSRAKRGDFRK